LGLAQVIFRVEDGGHELQRKVPNKYESKFEILGNDDSRGAHQMAHFRPQDVDLSDRNAPLGQCGPVSAGLSRPTGPLPH
jgi:hypothetical protein